MTAPNDTSRAAIPGAARGPRRRPATGRGLRALAALGLAALCCACGVKGPPRPPERPAPATPVRAAPATATGAGAGAETTCDTCGQARPAPGGAEGR